MMTFLHTHIYIYKFFHAFFKQFLFYNFIIFQHFLAMFFSNLGISVIISTALCMAEDPVVRIEIFGVIFFTSGLCSIIQVLLGVR